MACRALCGHENTATHRKSRAQEAEVTHENHRVGQGKADQRSTSPIHGTTSLALTTPRKLGFYKKLNPSKQWGVGRNRYYKTCPGRGNNIVKYIKRRKNKKGTKILLNKHRIRTWG